MNGKQRGILLWLMIFFLPYKTCGVISTATTPAMTAASEARAELKCFFRLDVTFTDIVYSEISIGFRFGLVLC